MQTQNEFLFDETTLEPLRTWTDPEGVTRFQTWSWIWQNYSCKTHYLKWFPQQPLQRYQPAEWCKGFAKNSRKLKILWLLWSKFRIDKATFQNSWSFRHKSWFAFRRLKVKNSQQLTRTERMRERKPAVLTDTSTKSWFSNIWTSN